MKNTYERISSAHADNLPTIRISKIKIQNLKSVSHGEVSFACSKEFIPEGTKSDILGLYGQNGSGKTTFINTIALIKNLLSGRALGPNFSDLITVNETKAHVEVYFDFQYSNNTIREVIYTIELIRVLIKADELESSLPSEDEERKDRYLLRVLNEKVEYSGVVDGKKIKKQLILKAYSDQDYQPHSKLFFFIKRENYKKLLLKLQLEKKQAYEQSRSSIFSTTLFDLFDEEGVYSEYYQILLELMCYAQNYLFVISGISSGFIQFNIALPLYTEHGRYMIDTTGRQIYPKKLFDPFIKTDIYAISEIIKRIIPGMELIIKNITETKDKKGEDAISFELFSKRGDKEFPIKYEADGVIKIISYIKLFVEAFNQKSTTIAIDEFDSGIFEYLLGELLEIFEKHGKGQFIFTSHNLRPLEVLSKEFIYFTTTDPNNRYTSIRRIGHTNNLRLTYFRNILMGNDNINLYNKENQFSILKALKNGNHY